MPTHIRAMVQWHVGSTAPRDIVQITPCFRHQLGLDLGNVGWQDLADDLAEGIVATSPGGNARGPTVKLYDIEDSVPGGPPNRPKAISIQGPTNHDESVHPRELALCLSFNGGVNAPDQRGRLYFPMFSFVSGSTLPGVRPTGAMRGAVGAFATLFENLGGSNVDWGVWSPTKKHFTKAGHWYVDDEWDVQRRRGLPATSRTETATSG